MSVLTISPERGLSSPQVINDPLQICAELGRSSVLFEQWQVGQPLVADASEAQVIAAYQRDVDRLMKKNNSRVVDLVSIGPDHPKRGELRSQFLGEHTHSDFEARFFVEGRGLFYLHIKGQVYGLMCEAGDLISVPKGIPHWFDMGELPDFKCIRLFSDPADWVAEYTDSSIAASFPSFERFAEQYL
ncbi:1,2-dihydroxy-3-keto-5-methylthiopentene dioxygenase [hydrothermal vent metagenome]|uniref:acireductone dioxygenase (Fe(2+)-requiring) n=1 Tax=hydrothermal vent metagenome TaxID=652676 RepID=A0A3B0ZL71_9ZZZZ